MAIVAFMQRIEENFSEAAVNFLVALEINLDFK